MNPRLSIFHLVHITEDAVPWKRLWQVGQGIKIHIFEESTEISWVEVLAYCTGIKSQTRYIYICTQGFAGIETWQFCFFALMIMVRGN